MNKKLFECKVTFTYYAYAEDEYEAADFVKDVARDMYLQESVRAVEVTSKPKYLADDWTPEALVYHNDDGDIPLKKVLPDA